MKSIDGWADRLPFAAHLSAEEKELVSRSVTVRAYAQDSVLYANSGECLGFILLLSGRVRSILISPEGREVTLYRLGEGEMDVLSAFCVLSRITFRTQMVAETDCEALLVPPSALSRLKETNPAVKSWIYDRLMDRFSDVMHAMEQILFSRVDQRIARFLLDRYEQTGETRIAITQEQLAQSVNSVREVVARTIRPMEAAGVLASRRGQILIRDPEALREISKGIR